MIYKIIEVIVKPGCRDKFLDRQRIWNDVMSKQSGFLGVRVATDPKAPNTVHVIITMETREDLERFMHGDHDVIMEKTQMQTLYEHLEIRILDVVSSAYGPGVPVNTTRAI